MYFNLNIIINFLFLDKDDNFYCYIYITRGTYDFGPGFQNGSAHGTFRNQLGMR